MALTPPNRWAHVAREMFEEAAVEALNHATLEVMGDAQRRAPVAEGTLRGSAKKHDAEVKGDRVEAGVSFHTVYAARQHEETTWKHPLGGEAKYLETPLVQLGWSAFTKHIRKALQRRGL